MLRLNPLLMLQEKSVGWFKVEFFQAALNDLFEHTKMLHKSLEHSVMSKPNEPNTSPKVGCRRDAHETSVQASALKSIVSVMFEPLIKGTDTVALCL